MEQRIGGGQIVGGSRYLGAGQPSQAKIWFAVVFFGIV